jgi:hypothetical protein
MPIGAEVEADRGKAAGERIEVDAGDATTVAIRIAG